MSTPVEIYLAARDEFMRFADTLKGVGELIRKVGAAIEKNPASFRFSDASEGLPSEIMAIPQDVTISADQWPNAGQIIGLLRTYHDARTKTRNAWNAVPENLRLEMKPPPRGVLPHR